MKIINVIWQDIRSGKNLDIYIAIVIALVVSILGLVGQVNQVIISSAVLATLALVANGLLINRRENEDIRKALITISLGQNLANKFLRREYDRMKLRQILQTTQVAIFWGPNLTTHILLLRDIIEKRLKEGLKVRFLVTSPSGAAANMSVVINRNKSLKDALTTVETNFARLEKLRDETSPGNLEFRVLDYWPPYSVIAFDPHLQSGRMFVRLNGFRGPNETRPTFELTKAEDTDWFNYFVEQFEFGWKEAHEYSLDRKIQD